MDSIIYESERYSLINNYERVMESEYFEASWRLRIKQLRRRVINLLRETAKKCRKKKEYTRFLTDEEKRFNKNIYIYM